MVTGWARIEGVGPATRQQVVDLLGHANVRVLPVLDLAGQHPVDGYEVPTPLAEALHLLAPACVSPWSSNLSRKKDRDHVEAYEDPDDGGPPGQTRLGNLAPRHRFPHRVKTHGSWRLRQLAAGIYEWTYRMATATASTTWAPTPSAPRISTSITRRPAPVGAPDCPSAEGLWP